jgi:hypothetical protein
MGMSRLAELREKAAVWDEKARSTTNKVEREICQNMAKTLRLLAENEIKHHRLLIEYETRPRWNGGRDQGSDPELSS